MPHLLLGPDTYENMGDSLLKHVRTPHGGRGTGNETGGLDLYWGDIYRGAVASVTEAVVVAVRALSIFTIGRANVKGDGVGVNRPTPSSYNALLWPLFADRCLLTDLS